MVKEIFIEKKEEVENVLGTFLGSEHYDHIVDYDCDVYKPDNTLGGNARSTGNLLIKFRKNVFPQDLLDDAYLGLRDAAQESQNRGLAAGPKGKKLNNRDWVTKEQVEILEAVIKGTSSLTGIDPIDAIIEKYDGQSVADNRGRVWLRNKTKENNFDFDEWVANAKVLRDSNEHEEAAHQAEYIMKTYISTTTYANPVRSGISGYFGRYPRIPYCRATSYTASKTKEWQQAVPFLEAVSDKFKELLPDRYKIQKDFVDSLDENFVIGNSVFTTITVNKNFRTASHRDAGDLQNGFGNIICLGNNRYDGGLLIFPAFRVAVDLRPGDALLFDPHEIHGNTKIEPHEGHVDDFERITCVLYAREDMDVCESTTIERLRKEFVEKCKNNKDHPYWRPGFNGVWPGMFDSEEWIDFLYQNGMHEYVEQNMSGKEEPNSLSAFF